MKILFLLKKNLIYGSYSSVVAKSGLLNSARITSSQLKKHLKVKTELEICVDGNEIDKFLHKHRPKIAIIEAIWVTPDKLRELTVLHKKVLFVVLVHSETAFLAHEGNAVEWIKDYDDIERVFPAFNSKGTFEQFNRIGIVCGYLPNIYLDVKKGTDWQSDECDFINIGCFGAIRPFKNQLIQAVAAIIFCDNHKKNLHFHMNTSRIEQGGEGVLKNLKALFDGTSHKLVEHGWKERNVFLHTISQMDLGMQISYTESFNIIAADFVHEHIPIIVSSTIDWMPDAAKASVENIQDILDKMEHAYHNRNRMANKNTRFLSNYNDTALEVWEKFLKL